MNKCKTSPNDISELERLRNSHAALVEAMEDCNGVLDSINRQLAGKSVAVRAVLDKTRAALALANEGKL